MSKRIYIGNLAFSTTESSLNTIFSEYGAVESCRLITDRSTGQSKGFGFVEMNNDADADEAIEKLNGQEIEGRPIKVDEARPRASQAGGGDGMAPRRAGGGYASTGSDRRPIRGY